jgi:hypothetical protein
LAKVACGCVLRLPKAAFGPFGPLAKGVTFARSADVPSFPLAKGATFASCRTGRVKPP